MEETVSFIHLQKAAEWIARDSREILRPASENRDARLSLETILVSWLQLFGALPPHLTVNCTPKICLGYLYPCGAGDGSLEETVSFIHLQKAAEWIARDSREILRPASENRDIYIYIICTCRIVFGHSSDKP